MKNVSIKQLDKDPLDIVKYLLYRHSIDGEIITNLKMQKLLYYVYVWNLVIDNSRCFKERFQAWPNGPVLPSVYDKLKKFGASPINPNTIFKKESDVSILLKNINSHLKDIADQVYELYGTKSAFELVNLTHNELPWKNARNGLDPTEKSNKEISDDDIIEEYAKR